jgi:hypothetical protein
MSSSSFQIEFNDRFSSLLFGVDDILNDLFFLRIFLNPSPSSIPIEFDPSSDDESIIAPTESSFSDEESAFYLNNRSPTSLLESTEASFSEETSRIYLYHRSQSSFFDSMETSLSDDESEIIFNTRLPSTIYSSLETLVEEDIGSTETLVNDF